MAHPSALALLEDLVTIDSRTTCTDGVRTVNERLAGLLGELGFTTSWEVHQTLIGSWGEEGRPHLVLLGHADTVLGPEEVPFRIEGDRARGAGVADMKGGLVVMMEALRRSQGWRDCQVTVILNGSEESGTYEFPPVARRLSSGADAVINVEPGYLQADGSWSICRARKGIYRYRLTVHGQATHAGNRHEEGANAIRQLARLVEPIEALTDYDQQLTANVGVISGGKTYNMVPDEAMALLELRALEPAVLDAARDKLEALCQAGSVTSADGSCTCRIELEMLPGFPPFPVNKGTDALVQRYAALAPVEVVSIVRGGASDANHVIDLAPALDGVGVLGDGFHSDREWMDIPSLEPRIESLMAMLDELATLGDDQPLS